MMVCVCVCARARARVCVCVRARTLVRVCVHMIMGITSSFCLSVCLEPLNRLVSQLHGSGQAV